MRILPAADRTPVPWKNGQGVTREIAAHPIGAGMDDFDWRLSIATVAASGPFSHFPDVDRVLTVLDGRMTLAIAGRDPIEADPETPPIAFPGDVPVEAAVQGGPLTDLNVMVRRGRIAADVQRVAPGGGMTVDLDHCTIVVPLTRKLRLDIPRQSFDLSPLDAAIFDDGGVGTVSLSSDGDVLMIRLERVAG